MQTKISTIWSVGSQFPEGCNLLPIEGFSFAWGNNHRYIFAIYDNMTREEELAFTHSPINYAVTEQHGLGFLLIKTATSGWNEAPFHASFFNAQGVTPNIPADVEFKLDPEARIGVTVIAIERRGMIVKKIGFTTFSPAFSREICKIVSRQMQNPISKDTFLINVQLTQGLYSSDELASVAKYRCKGGD